MIQALSNFAEQHPFWNWITLIGTAALAWIAPVAGAVTISLGCLQGYIAWQKYKHWKRDAARSR